MHARSAEQDKRGPCPASPGCLGGSSEHRSRVRAEACLIRRHPRLTQRFMVRMTGEDFARLRSYAEAQSRPVSHAALYLIRVGLSGNPAEADLSSSRAPEPRADLLSELGFHNLIATEQVIQLLETIVRDGQGAADRLLAAAGRAAQVRLARGESLRFSRR